ncbi:MAG: 6-bladed beta-propeller [Tannerellaceae bacterium]|jgi:hypothetical protein|nr:6-bladed beta-propeller [Tannerellaceae bacterium]
MKTFLGYIKYNSAIIVFIALFIACVARNEKENNTGSHESREILIESRQKKTPKSEDIFKELEYIQLETADSALLSGDDGTGIKILFRNDQIYYADYYTVHIFDNKGRFLRKINHHGDSPADYALIGSFDVFKNGDILILSPSTRRILCYSCDDRFINQYTDDSPITDIACLNDSLFVAKRDYINHEARFLFINRNSSRIASQHTPVKLRKAGTSLGEAFTGYDGKLLLNECQNNNIYEITPSSLNLRYTINIDNRIPPDGFWEQPERDPMSLFEECDQKGYIDNITFFSESDNSILFYYRDLGSNHGGYTFVNKQSMEYILFDEIELETGFTWKPDYMFAQSDGQVLIPVPADIILSLPKTSNLRKRFGNLKEDDNPIIIIAKLK